MTSTSSDATMLSGYTVAVTDPHQHQFAGLLRRYGATVDEFPLLEPVPASRDARLRAATRRSARAPLDYLIATTTGGLHRWLDAAETWHLRSALLAALANASIVTASPAVTAWLRKHDLTRRRIAILSADAPPSYLLAAVLGRRAEVIDVRTVRWAPAAGLAPLDRLARKIIRREVHAVAFSSAVAAAALIDVAMRAGLHTKLMGAFLTDVLVAGAGAEPVAPFLERAVPALWPATRGSSELAAIVAAELVRRRRQFVARGIQFALQGDVLFADDATIRLGPGPAAVLRTLADHPDITITRSALAQMSALSRGTRAYGSDVAISRLRVALGEHHWLVSTDSRHGYRLAETQHGNL